MTNPTDTSILRAIAAMSKQRFQDPKIKQWKNGNYYIRPWVDVLQGNTTTREKQVIQLGPDKRRAIAEKARVMGLINKGQHVLQAQTTLDMLLVEYSKHIAKLGYATQQKYETHLNSKIVPRWGKCQLSEITTLEAQNWLDSLKLSWNTKTDIRNIMSGIFTKAVQWGFWQQRNPLQDVFVGRKTTVWKRRKLTIDETRALLAELDPVPRVVSMVALFTTLRISEILGLQEKHLNFSNENISVEQRFYRGDLDTTKTDKSTRTVTMSGLTEYLRSLCIGDPEHFIFQSHESCHSDENLRKRHLTPAAKRLGLYQRGFGFHSLRREAITEIGQAVGPQIIMSMAGHTKMDLTMLYTLGNAEAQRAGAAAYMERVVRPGEFESPTFAVSGQRSNQLS